MNGANVIIKSEKGFSLVEFLAAATILIIMGASMFSVMAEMERNAGYQSEVQAVLGNTRTAMNTVTRYIRGAGNNPLGAVFDGLTIASASSVRLRTDVTGSSLADPNRGDPDGDTNDVDEDVTLRYNAGARTIECVLGDGTVRTIANRITAFNMQYFDASGGVVAAGADVRRVRVTISGSSNLAHLQTQQTFGITEVGDVQLVTR